MSDLKLVFPSEEREREAIEYVNEFIEYDSKNHGCGGLDRYAEDYSRMVKKTRR